MDADVREPVCRNCGIDAPEAIGRHDPLCAACYILLTPPGIGVDNPTRSQLDEWRRSVPATPPRTPAPSLQAAREAVETMCEWYVYAGCCRWCGTKKGRGHTPECHVSRIRALLDWLDGGVVVYVCEGMRDIVDEASADSPLNNATRYLCLPLPKEADDDR